MTDDPKWIVVATATNPKSQLTALGAHLKYFGYPFYVARYGSVWEGFKTKLQVEEETARALKPETMVVYLDAYDVMANGSLSDLKTQYKKVAKRGEIVIQQDKNCHPDKSLAPAMHARMPNHKHPFCNSGVIIGPAGKFVEIFDQFPIAGFKDDQQYWCSVIINMSKDNPVIIDVDKVCSIMYRLCPNFSWKSLEDGTKVLQLPDGQTPCFVHFPGIDKTQMPRLLRQTQRRGIPGAYRYPVFEIFIAVCVFALALLIATIVLSVAYAKNKRNNTMK